MPAGCAASVAFRRVVQSPSEQTQALVTTESVGLASSVLITIIATFYYSAITVFMYFTYPLLQIIYLNEFMDSNGSIS